mmetsp:Transcript_5011/g.10112  ORF Transcript_5011/g.10112 Transcript_5011/m.10112 type:complete len:116 (+) Transcript_5011:1025-1372(+)
MKEERFFDRMEELSRMTNDVVRIGGVPDSWLGTRASGLLQVESVGIGSLREASRGSEYLGEESEVRAHQNVKPFIGEYELGFSGFFSGHSIDPSRRARGARSVLVWRGSLGYIRV